MKSYLTFIVACTLCIVTVKSNQWTPKLEKTATKEQHEFYNQFDKVLPYLDISDYPEDSVKVYIYPGVKDQVCTDNTKPLYFTWYSTKYLVPILSGFKSNSCGNKNNCPNEKRYAGSFATCGISGVDNTTYRYSGFDRGHLVNSQSMARMYKASCETFTMCNIAPMTPQLNRYDWVEIENLIETESEEKNLYVLQGSLLSGYKNDQYAECVCGTEKSGRVACSRVKESKCNKQNLEIRIPNAFYKIVYNIEKDLSWSFIYKHNLDNHSERIDQTPSEAFIGKDIAYLERYAKFDWPTIRDTAEEYCDWCHSANDKKVPTVTTTKLITGIENTNFKYLSFYGLNPEAQHDIINIGGEGSLKVKLEMYEKYKIPSFYGDVDGVFNRTVRPTTLINGWENKIETMYKTDIEPYIGKELLGIFLGDEICCHDVPCWENVLEPVASKFRSLLGEDQGIIYTNECANENITSIPVSLDAISIDTYAGYKPGSTGDDEVKQAKVIYELIFSKLRSHQSVLLVPGIFACSNESYISLDTIDENTVEKLNGYYNWAMKEPRIIGMNPWHFNNRSSPQHHPPCDMKLGAIAMPKTLAKLKEIKAKVGPVLPTNKKECSKYGNDKNECIASKYDCVFCTGGWAHMHGCYSRRAASRLPPGMFTCTKKN